jgi:hypothetical protein
MAAMRRACGDWLLPIEAWKVWGTEWIPRIVELRFPRQHTVGIIRTRILRADNLDIKIGQRRERHPDYLQEAPP